MKVGLYIPCFNAEHTIRQCLDSVFRQAYPLEEVVIIDDGSTDTSASIAREYPVKVIRHEENKGLASARNTALHALNPEFIASLDADCCADPEWLACAMRNFDSPHIAGVGGKLLDDHTASVFDLWRSVHMRQHWDDLEKFPEFLFGSNTVFRKKALIEAGGYNEVYGNNYEDTDISQRIIKAGHRLVYEPKAKVNHLRRDDITSVFTTYWNWHRSFYQKEGYYDHPDKLKFKIKDNFGLANRYLEEDLAAQRHQLLYLDFLLAFHHSLKDFEYFIVKEGGQCPRHVQESSMLSLWLALCDLTFFCHFDSAQDSLSTFLSRNSAFAQNIFAMNLIVGKPVKERFGAGFQASLYRHLFLSMHTITDPLLLETLLRMTELHSDWGMLSKKRHAHLNSSFLEGIYENVRQWIDGLMGRFPGLLAAIETSQQASG